MKAECTNPEIFTHGRNERWKEKCGTRESVRSDDSFTRFPAFRSIMFRVPLVHRTNQLENDEPPFLAAETTTRWWKEIFEEAIRIETCVTRAQFLREFDRRIGFRIVGEGFCRGFIYIGLRLVGGRRKEGMESNKLILWSICLTFCNDGSCDSCCVIFTCGNFNDGKYRFYSLSFYLSGVEWFRASR